MTPDSSDSSESPDSLPSHPPLELREGVWWFDAGSSRRLRAELRFTNNEVRATNEAGERRDARLSDVRISPRLANAPRTFTFADGVCVSADNNDFIDRVLATQDGGRKNFALYVLESRRIFLFLAIAAILFFFGGAVYGVPVVAEMISVVIPKEHLDKTDELVYQQLQKQNIIRPSELLSDEQMRMQNIFNRVAAENKNHEYDFRLVAHKFPANAFALPGGRIIAADPLASLLTDDELAAVFAHEIGHVVHRHGTRAILSSAGILAFLALAGGDFWGLSAGAALLNMKYSRAHEEEADCFAYKYLQQNNMRTDLVGTALKKMEEAVYEEAIDDVSPSEADSEQPDDKTQEGTTKTWETIFRALSTHPPTEARINLAQSCS